MINNAKIVGVGVNPEQYHAARQDPRGSREWVMSPSQLKEFGACPRRWRDGYEPPDSKAKDWGSLLDCMILTPNQVAERYACTPETYERDGVAKTWRNDTRIPEVAAWIAENEGKNIVSKEVMDNALAAVDRMNKDEILTAWRDACDTQVWVSAEWHDPQSKLVVPVRALLDYVAREDTEFQDCAGDLKCVRCANLRPFTRQVFQMGWHIQAAFCLDLLSAAEGRERSSWCWVIQESFPPFQTGRRLLSQKFLTLGRATYQRLLGTYCNCLMSGRWPDYDDMGTSIQGWSVVDSEEWMHLDELDQPWRSTVDADEYESEVPS